MPPAYICDSKAKTTQEFSRRGLRLKQITIRNYGITCDLNKLFCPVRPPKFDQVGIVGTIRGCPGMNTPRTLNPI